VSPVLFELLLGGGLVLLAVRLLWGAAHFEAIVLFIVFGTLMALVWATLGAPDVAMAEAAIGAGLTGALLLAAWRHVGDGPDSASRARARGWRWRPVGVAGVGAALGLGLERSLAAPAHGGGRAAGGLAVRVMETLPDSGVENPVTAVLLAFRGYDTLLEVSVLVIAWLAVVGPAPAEPQPVRSGPVLPALAHVWAPLVLLVCGHVVWAGARAPGGAFQAAALLAGTAILLRLVGVRISVRLPKASGVVLPVAGLALFGAAAAWGLWRRGHLLAYPVGHAGAWIFAIELGMTLSLATLLFLLYRAVHQHREDSESC